MKTRLFLVVALVFALAVPATVFGTPAPASTTAKFEFTLGGFVKLDAFWDATQEGKNMNTLIQRSNNGAFHHGRMKFTSQGSRFNFAIKGPDVWGAHTLGYIEIDFDPAETGIGGAANSASNSYSLRLRHAFMRFSWPATTLYLGQTWSMFSRWYPELAQDGPFQITGTPTARLAQVRVDQRFAEHFTVGLLVGEANSITQGESYSANDRNGGESTECPQIQGHFQYQQDLYGKSAWYGKPTPFTVDIVAGWQQGWIQEGFRGLLVTGQNNYGAVVGYTRHQKLNPWVVQGNMFIPVITTHSANLAGTASLQTSWWIGQGVEAFGWIGYGSQLFRFNGFDPNVGAAGANVYDVVLMPRFGGQVMGQYYFTNEWFVTAAWGMSHAFGLNAYETTAGPGLRDSAFAADVANYHNEVDVCLWYRPIQAFKFGLQYSYARTNWVQRTWTGGTDSSTDFGDTHNVRFVGLFFF